MYGKQPVYGQQQQQQQKKSVVHACTPLDNPSPEVLTHFVDIRNPSPEALTHFVDSKIAEDKDEDKKKREKDDQPGRGAHLQG